MSKTYVLNEVTGEQFPRKSRRKVKDRKVFGSIYPCELRHKSVIESKINNDILKDLTNEND